MDTEKKAGDDCKLVDGTDGILAEQEGGLVCVPKQFEDSAAEKKEAGEKAEVAPVAGNVCKLEDGSDGVLEDQDGILVCVVKGE